MELKKKTEAAKVADEQEIAEEAKEAKAPPAKAPEAKAKAKSAPTLSAPTAAQITAARDLLAQVDAASPKSEGEELDTPAVFISRYPALTMHVEVKNRTELDRNRVAQPVTMPIQFKNGLYSTSNSHTAVQLRTLALRHRQYFREEKDERIAAVTLEAYRVSKLQQGGSVSGVATSDHGAAPSQLKTLQELEAIQTAAFNGQDIV